MFDLKEELSGVTEIRQGHDLAADLGLGVLGPLDPLLAELDQRRRITVAPHQRHGRDDHAHQQRHQHEPRRGRGGGGARTGRREGHPSPSARRRRQ